MKEQRNLIQEALLKGEERLQALLDDYMVAVYLKDLQGRYLMVNRHCEIMFRFTREWVAGKTDHEIFPKQMADVLRANDRQALEADAPWEFEEYFLREDGEHASTTTKFPLYDADRNPYALCSISTGIVRREETERSLKEAEASYRALVEGLPELICQFLPDEMRLTWVNEAYCRYFGKSREELIGNSFLPLLSEEDRKPIKEAILSLNRENPEGTFEHRVWRADGEARWQQWTNRAVYDDEGNFVEYQAVGRDFNVRKLAEEALRESEERFRNLTDATFEGIAIIENGEVLETNQAYADMFGYELSEVRGMPVLDLHPPEAREEVWQKISSGYGEPYESKGLKKDGTLFDIEIRGKTASYKDRSVRVTAIRDITERKWAEEALKESEERYRQLVENSPETIAVLSEERIVFINAAGARQAGADDSEELIGKPYLDFVHPDFREVVRARISQAQEGKPAELLQQKLLRLDGSTVDVETVAIPTTYEDKPAVLSVIRDITERKKAEEALRESEERFRFLVQHTSDIISIIEADGTVRYESPAIERVMGYRPEELVGQNAFDYVHPDDIERVSEAFIEVLDTRGVNPPVEFRLRHADGSWRYLEVVGNNLIDDPSVRGIVVSARDVTRRKQTEDALRRSEEWFRSLIQNSSDITVVIDANGTILYQSPSMERVLGYRPEERVGKNISESNLLHPEDLDAKNDAIAEAMRSPGVNATAEVRMRHCDGSWRYIEATIRSLLDDPNVGGVVINARDITERKEAAARLRESEERFRSAFEDAPIGIALVGLPSSPSSDRRYLRVNRALCEMLGYSEEELLSKTTSDVTHPEDREISRAYAKQVMNEGHKHGLEKRYIHADGHVVWALLNISLVRDSEGNPSHFISQFMDVTERRRSEEALRKSEANLAEAQRLAHLGSWEWNVVTNETSWSDEIYRICGFSPKEFAPTFDRFMEAVHPDDRERIRKAIDGTLYENEPYDLNHRLVRPNGEVRLVHCRGRLVFDEEGKPLRMIGSVHDITERERAQEELRESEERYRAVVEQSVESVFLFDPDTKRILESNTALRRLLGYTSEELLEMTVYDLVAHERDEIDSDIRRDLREKRRFAGERKYRRKDGSLVDVEVSMTVIPYYGREVLCHLARDITERKALEEQLRHQAFHDSLTSLPNRTLFLDRLQHALARSGRLREPVAVLLVDLDDFKIVNDSLGHDAGNLLLIGVGERLRDSVRPGDTVARLFGDEFAILLEAPAGVEEACRVAERIGSACRRPSTSTGRRRS